MIIINLSQNKITTPVFQGKKKKKKVCRTHSLSHCSSPLLPVMLSSSSLLYSLILTFSIHYDWSR